MDVLPLAGGASVWGESVMAGPCFSVLSSRASQQLLHRQLPYYSALEPSCSTTSRVSFGRPLRIRPRLLVFRAEASKSRSRSAASTPGSKKSRKEDEDEDAAWESFLEQLERDLENDTEGIADEDITEEDVVELERELETVYIELSEEATSLKGNNVNETGDAVVAEDEGSNEENASDEEDDEDNASERGDAIVAEDEGSKEEDENDEDIGQHQESYDEDEFDEDEPRKVRLDRWQLRKLAAAAELGRRKVNVKSLAAELGLDRADVLAFLKDPPADLLLMSALQEPTEDETDELQPEKITSGANSEAPTNKINSSIRGVAKIEESGRGKGRGGPMDWSKNKRLRKDQLETFERVYRRTTRPTNSLIENLVQLTNLPRTRIVEWFDKRRLSDAQSASSKESWTSSKR